MRNRRIGNFRVCAELIEKSPNKVRAIMDNCIIVRAEMDYCSNSISYTAICDRFDEVPEFCLAPNYDVEIRQGDDGSYVAAFVRAEA